MVPERAPLEIASAVNKVFILEKRYAAGRTFPMGCNPTAASGSLGQCRRRVRPDFRQREMVVRQGREFVDGHPFRQRRDDLVDQISAEWPDARAAEDFTRLWIAGQ
jgi:hypothetical protein